MFFWISLLYEPGPIGPVIVLLKSLRFPLKIIVDWALSFVKITLGRYSNDPGVGFFSYGFSFCFPIAPPIVFKVLLAS